MHNIKHFSFDELSCRCCGIAYMNMEFLLKLDELRGYMDRPLVVTSAFRCVKHNKAVGGVNNSYHKKGRAVDVSLHGWTIKEYHKLIYFAGVLKLRLIIYCSLETADPVFVHIDNKDGLSFPILKEI